MLRTGRKAKIPFGGGQTWLTFASSNYRVIIIWFRILHNESSFSLCYDWTRLWILIWKVGHQQSLSVKAKRVCPSSCRNQLVMTPGILISEGQPHPTSPGYNHTSNSSWWEHFSYTPTRVVGWTICKILSYVVLMWDCGISAFPYCKRQKLLEMRLSC